MKRKQTRVPWLLILIFGLLLMTSLTLVAAPRSSDGSYTLDWVVAASSGPFSSSGAYSLTASSGQAVTDTSTNGKYRLTSGYWAGSGPQEYVLYLPITISQ